jgi:hypothetical protein
MLKFNCKVVGGNIPEGEFVIVEVDAENAGYALPLAIVNHPGSFVLEITQVS